MRFTEYIPIRTLLLHLYIIAYVSYTAILKLDAAYNNPVMNVFVYLMSGITEDKSEKNEPYSSCKQIQLCTHHDLYVFCPLDIDYCMEIQYITVYSQNFYGVCLKLYDDHGQTKFLLQCFDL